jgi:hypothetical protein
VAQSIISWNGSIVALSSIAGATRWWRVRSSLVAERSSCVRAVYSERMPLLWRVVFYERQIENVAVWVTAKRQFLPKIRSHLPYSPDLAACDFFFFPRLKEKLRWRRFQSAEEIGIRLCHKGNRTRPSCKYFSAVFPAAIPTLADLHSGQRRLFWGRMWICVSVCEYLVIWCDKTTVHEVIDCGSIWESGFTGKEYRPRHFWRIHLLWAPVKKET